MVARLQLSEVVLLQLGRVEGGLESRIAGSVCTCVCVKERVCLSHHILLQEWGHNLPLCSRNLTRAGNCISLVHMTLCVGVIVRMCMYVCVEHRGEAPNRRSEEAGNSWPFIDSFWGLWGLVNISVQSSCVEGGARTLFYKSSAPLKHIYGEWKYCSDKHRQGCWEH